MSAPVLKAYSKHLARFPIPLEVLPIIIETALLTRQVNQIEFSIRFYFDGTAGKLSCALSEPKGDAQ